MSAAKLDLVAAEARERLLALGPAAGERAELAAAGVPSGTIDALYPGSFAELVPVLTARLTTHASQVALNKFAGLDTGAAKLIRQLPPALRCESEDAYTTSLSYHIELYTLHAYLAERLGQPKTVDVAARFTPERLRLDALNRCLWQAHWLALNYHRVPAEQHPAVDLLVTRMAELAGLGR